MSSRTVLTVSSILLFVPGGLAVFAADEVAGSLGLEISFGPRMFAEVAGIGMLALTLQNWMSRGRPIGGAYARPLGLGNLLFFASSALALGRYLAAEMLPIEATAVCGVLALLALAFVRPVFSASRRLGSRGRDVAGVLRGGGLTGSML